eukprot:gene10164-3217_t
MNYSESVSTGGDGRSFSSVSGMADSALRGDNIGDVMQLCGAHQADAAQLAIMGLEAGVCAATAYGIAFTYLSLMLTLNGPDLLRICYYESHWFDLVQYCLSWSSFLFSLGGAFPGRAGRSRVIDQFDAAAAAERSSMIGQFDAAVAAERSRRIEQFDAAVAAERSRVMEQFDSAVAAMRSSGIYQFVAAAVAAERSRVIDQLDAAVAAERSSGIGKFDAAVAAERSRRIEQFDAAVAAERSRSSTVDQNDAADAAAEQSSTVDQNDAADAADFVTEETTDVDIDETVRLAVARQTECIESAVAAVLNIYLHALANFVTEETTDEDIDEWGRYVCGVDQNDAADAAAVNPTVEKELMFDLDLNLEVQMFNRVGAASPPHVDLRAIDLQYCEFSDSDFYKWIELPDAAMQEDDTPSVGKHMPRDDPVRGAFAVADDGDRFDFEADEAAEGAAGGRNPGAAAAAAAPGPPPGIDDARPPAGRRRADGADAAMHVDAGGGAGGERNPGAAAAAAAGPPPGTDDAEPPRKRERTAREVDAHLAKRTLEDLSKIGSSIEIAVDRGIQEQTAAER